MSTIPVSSIEDADCFAIFGRQTVEELDETAFVVNLQYGLMDISHA